MRQRAICHSINAMWILIHGQAYYGYEIQSYIASMTLRAGLRGQVQSKSRLSSPVSERWRYMGILGRMADKRSMRRWLWVILCKLIHFQFSNGTIHFPHCYFSSLFLSVNHLFSPFLLLQPTFAPCVPALGFSWTSFQIYRKQISVRSMKTEFTNITPHQ